MTTGFHPGTPGSEGLEPVAWGGEYFPAFLLVSILIHAAILAAIFTLPQTRSAQPPNVSWIRLTGSPEVPSAPPRAPVPAPAVRQPVRAHPASPSRTIPPVVRPETSVPPETLKPSVAVEPPLLPTLPGESASPDRTHLPPAVGQPIPAAPTPHEILFDDEALARASRAAPEAAERGKSDITFDTREFKYAGYMRQLKSHIEGVWKYPEDAVERNVYGDLFITFTIRKDGTLGSVKLTRTSGFKSLDDAALAALRNSAPFWPLPEWWEEDGLTINGHFVYTISGHYVR